MVGKGVSRKVGKGRGESRRTRTWVILEERSTVARMSEVSLREYWQGYGRGVAPYTS